jgi:hypothetical protein
LQPSCCEDRSSIYQHLIDQTQRDNTASQLFKKIPSLDRLAFVVNYPQEAVYIWFARSSALKEDGDVVLEIQ